MVRKCEPAMMSGFATKRCPKMATTSKDVGSIPKLHSNEVQLLWHVDFWDGPINGLCLYHNEKFWFELWTDEEEEIPDSGSRRFLVVKLAPHQLADEEYWHDLFRQKVGTHTDYGEAHPEVKPRESHREFYEPYQQRAKPDYSGNPVIGWFEWE
jgi:hypothetical protein